ncbi:MAG: metallophosphoesterase [Acidobacteriota bacterium]
MDRPTRDPAAYDPSVPFWPIAAGVLLWFGAPWLTIGAWLHPWLPGGWLGVVALLLLVPVPVWTMVRGLRGVRAPSKAARLFIMRPFWYAALIVPVLACVTLAGGAIGWALGAAGAGGRLGLGIGALALTTMLIAGYFGAQRLVVRPLEAHLPRLPPAFDGLRIVQISDLHVGPHTSTRFLARVVDAVTAVRGDLVVVTGDQVDDYPSDAQLFARAFAPLQDAPLGVYAIAGNHDIFGGWPTVHRTLADAGFRVLVNDAVSIVRDGARLWLAGTGDPAAMHWPRADARAAAPNIDATLARVAAGEPVIALAHNPALWPLLAARGVDLTLSGHTHYGQFAVPRRNWSLASPFLALAMGIHRRGRALLYINPGTNHWGIPFRLGTPPEVTVVTLRGAANGEARIAPGTTRDAAA